MSILLVEDNRRLSYELMMSLVDEGLGFACFEKIIKKAMVAMTLPDVNRKRLWCYAQNKGQGQATVPTRSEGSHHLRIALLKAGWYYLVAKMCVKHQQHTLAHAAGAQHACMHGRARMNADSVPWC